MFELISCQTLFIKAVSIASQENAAMHDTIHIVLYDDHIKVQIK